MHHGTYRPPMKWRPVKYFTSGLGAVRLTNVAGMNLVPSPDLGGPFSISHEDGASTEVTGILVSSRAWMTAGKGSRTSPEKLNPINALALSHDIAQEACVQTENGIHNVVSRRQSGGEVVNKGYFEIF